MSKTQTNRRLSVRWVIRNIFYIVFVALLVVNVFGGFSDAHVRATIASWEVLALLVAVALAPRLPVFVEKQTGAEVTK